MKGKRKHEDVPEASPDRQQKADGRQGEGGEAAIAANTTPEAGTVGEAGGLVVETEVERLRAALAAMENRCVRLQADFSNHRTRTLKERDDVWRRAHAELIEELLPALDHMDLALDAAAARPDGKSFQEGFRIVRDQLAAALGKFGLAGFDVVGEEFDHNRHEAIAHTPSQEVEENRVLAQTRKGYLLGERLLRPAQVVVSSGPADASAGQPAMEGEG